MSLHRLRYFGIAISAHGRAPDAVWSPGPVPCETALRIERRRTGKSWGASRGDGAEWGEHDGILFEGTEWFFRPNYVGNLVGSWIPALDGVEARLKAGATVADVGCGFGACFDCLHDMADPVGAARHTRQTLAADGPALGAQAGEARP